MHDSAWSTKTWQRGWNLVKILESGVSFLNIPQLCAWMPHCQVKQIEPELSGSPSLTWWNNTSPMGCSGSHSELSAWVCLWIEDDAVSGKWDVGLSLSWLIRGILSGSSSLTLYSHFLNFWYCWFLIRNYYHHVMTKFIIHLTSYLMVWWSNDQ